MPTQSMSSQHLAQSQRIDRSCALLVVIKIDENGAAPLLPLRDLARPMAQRPVRVVIAVASAGSMTPDIDMARRYFPWRWRIVMIGQAERNIAPVKELENIIVIPTLVTKFESVGIARGQHLEECIEPVAVLRELGRQLKQDCLSARALVAVSPLIQSSSHISWSDASSA
jgi:hypothetical protein